MRSYYMPLDDNKYNVTSYRLSRSKGVYLINYFTKKEEPVEPQSEEDLRPIENTAYDRRLVLNHVIRENATSMVIPCYTAISIYRIKLRIVNSLGNNAVLNIFDDEYIIGSFKLSNDGTAFDPGEYVLQFTWDGIEDYYTYASEPATLDTENGIIDIMGASNVSVGDIVYVKIQDDITSEYKFIPFILNRQPLEDENHNIIPMNVNVQVSGIDQTGLAQLTVESYPLVYVEVPSNE